MDNLLRHKRSNHPGPGQEYYTEQAANTAQLYLAPLKSQSFREKKTTVSWLGRQFSRKMSRGNEFSDDGIERATAVAAAVFAIHSVEESEFAVRPKKKADRPETSSFPKTKNLKENIRTHYPRPTPETDSDKASRQFSNKDVLRDTEKVAVISEQQKQKQTEKITVPGDDGPYLKRTASFSGDKKTEPGISGDRRTEPEKPVAVSIPRPPTPPISRTTRPTDTKKPGPVQTKADLWEKDQMAKIKERYQKVNETISYWENKKREKATSKLQESQAVGVPRKKRERGRKKFEEDMEFIKEIAGEARRKADEKRRNEILKANQKADIIRQTGSLPVTCCCC